MVYISKKITYLGVDETSVGIIKGGFIVTVAETTNPALSKPVPLSNLMKAKDYLRQEKIYRSDRQIINYKNMPKFPSLNKMKEQGLNNFYWTRANNGRFSRQLVEHASIAHVVASNGYNPKSTVIMIDAFYGRNEMSVHLIQEYLKAQGFDIPRQNILIEGGGDKTIPIINFADLLSFQIGLHLNKTYKKYHPDSFDFEIEPKEIDYDIQRVIKPIGDKGRNNLEKAILSWKNGQK